MNLKHLEAFLAVIDTGSVGGAAARLGRPQPTLSHQLRALEDELGTPLIERGGSGGPTLEGHTLVPIARRMLALASDARKALSGLSCRIAAASNIGTYILQPLAQNYRKTCGGKAPLDIWIGRNPQAIERVEDGRSDIALTEWWDDRPGYMATPWYRDPLVAIVAPSHPLAKNGRITPRQLLDERMIGGESGTGTGRILRAALKSLGNDLEVDETLGSTAAVKEAVKAGAGISVVGTSVVRDELSSGRLVALALSGRTLEKTYYAVRRLSDMAPDRTEGFVDFITRRV